MDKKWYSVGKNFKLQCVNCSTEIKVTWADYTIQMCGNCKVESIFYSFDEKKVIQIIPKFAPNEINLFIEWAEKGGLDELEFLELIGHFEDIARSIGKL